MELFNLFIAYKKYVFWIHSNTELLIIIEKTLKWNVIFTRHTLFYISNFYAPLLEG